MSHPSSPSSLLEHDSREAPIEVYFGNPSLDYGIATVPKLLPRYWIYLISEGKRLSEREYALLMQVLLLREAQDFELRVTNIPMQCPTSTLTRSLAVLRQMGLVFTERVYYSPRPGKPPTMRAQRWDMRSLFYNLEQIAQVWSCRQKEAVVEWERAGRKGRRPLYTFPEDFAFEVVLLPEVALDILQGKFFPVALRWQQQARISMSGLHTAGSDEGLPTTQDLRGTDVSPTAQNLRDRAPTAQNLHGHLLEDEEEEEEDAALVERVFAYFAGLKGDPHYHPTVKEQLALKKLLGGGFTFAQIIAGMDDAFARPNRPRHFTHCAAIARDLARSQQECRQPEARTQPETRQPEALLETGERVAEMPAGAPTSAGSTPQVIEVELSRAVDVYRSAERELTPDVLARFRLMAARGDAAARARGSTGGDWLADALTIALGVAKPGNLLNYADAVLNDWITNGKGEKPTRPPRKPHSAKRSQPGVHQGIWDYLNKHGGVPHGDPD